MTLFSPRLLNGPFGDAALLLESVQSPDKVLFDLGDLHRLNPRDLAKISLIFVTHAHMDHFSGFEQLLRQNLNRPTPLHLFGPQNFIKQVAAKLQGFTWNLITDSCYTLELIVHEVTARKITTQCFRARQVFTPDGKPLKHSFNGLLYHSEAFKVECAILDHGTPVLGLALTEARHFNIKPEHIDRMGLQKGPWLKDLKNALTGNFTGESTLIAPLRDGGAGTFSLDQLRQGLVYETPPYKLAYITDLAYSLANIRKVRRLAYKADMLYLEAAFTAADNEMAAAKKHLTAQQAGRLARQCGARQLEVFHFSERYQQNEEELRQEAAQAFNNSI